MMLQTTQRAQGTSNTWIDQAKDLRYHTRNVEGADDRVRHFLFHGEKGLSAWHDIPLRNEGDELDVFNSVIEIERATTMKMEVETTMAGNPIVQDQKKDKKTGELKLRHYALPTLFNYGQLPQTWENAQEKDRATDCFGDNDPLDVVDLTGRAFPLFSMPKLKILGCACLIDQEELDWKLFAVEEGWAKEHGIKNMESYHQHNPGHVKEIMEWFRVIKTYDGKPANRFAYDDQILSVEKTLEIIEHNYQSYKDLVSGKIGNPDGLALPQ